MEHDNGFSNADRIAEDSRAALDSIIREGAQQMLEVALKSEVADYIERHAGHLDESGKRLVVRNGSMPERVVQSGAGPLEVRQPRVNDRREGEQFTSAILPKYLRRAPSLDSLIPILYLKGISTNDFPVALSALLGDQAKGLSPSTVVRLKKDWEKEYKEWETQSLEDKNYVYFWADGIYCNVRLADDRPCLLVIIGTLESGRKELVAVYDGERESKLSWKEVLRGLKKRGLKKGPKLAVGDGALGFWAALREEYPGTKEQRCWVHKTGNVLDKMPRSVKTSAKKAIHDMYHSPTKEDALIAFDEFMNLYETKHPKACECLRKDKDVLFTFYDFPAEHWPHIRSTNPIESTFATVRLRTKRTKGAGSRTASLTMVFKLCLEAQKRWKRIKGYEVIPFVVRGDKFVDGIRKTA